MIECSAISSLSTVTGFELGSKVQSKTKGIWIWCTPHPQKTKTCLMLLDTEGLGDPEKVIYTKNECSKKL